jgi:hypothetical protein
VSITDSKIDSVADILVLRESASSFNERKTMINAERLAGEVAAVREKTRRRPERLPIRRIGRRLQRVTFWRR